MRRRGPRTTTGEAERTITMKASKTLPLFLPVVWVLVLLCPGCASPDRWGWISYRSHYHFSLRTADIDGKKHIFELLKDFLPGRGFEYMGEAYTYFLEKPPESYSKEQLKKIPWVQVFTFYSRKYDAVCYYIPQKDLVTFREEIPYNTPRRDEFRRMIADLKKLLLSEKIKFRYESNMLSRSWLESGSNYRFAPFHPIHPRTGSHYKVENYD